MPKMILKAYEEQPETIQSIRSELQAAVISCDMHAIIELQAKQKARALMDLGEIFLTAEHRAAVWGLRNKWAQRELSSVTNTHFEKYSYDQTKGRIAASDLADQRKLSDRLLRCRNIAALIEPKAAAAQSDLENIRACIELAIDGKPHVIPPVQFQAQYEIDWKDIEAEEKRAGYPIVLKD